MADRFPRTLGLIALLGALSTSAASTWADEIRTLDGETETQVLGLERERDRLLVVTPTARFDARTVREIRFEAARGIRQRAPVRLFLRNGDEIPGRIAPGTDETIVLDSPTLGRISAPLDLVQAVALTSDPAALDRLRAEVLPTDPEQDFVVLPSWDRKVGTLEKVSPDGVTMDIPELGSFTLGTDKAIAVRLAPLVPLAPAEGERARLELTCGASVEGRISRLKDGVLTLDTLFQKATIVKVEHVKSLAFQGGAFAYVSDLEPIEVDTRSEVIGIVFPPRRDRAVLGGPLTLMGRTYRKGLGVKAYTRYAFDLEAGYERFRAVIGLDDTARARSDVEGTVAFQVLVDGKPMLGKDGLVLTNRQDPRPIDIPLTGASRLELIADFGPSGDILARGVFADAYLVKR